jgi:outer membrane protein TolC
LHAATARVGVAVADLFPRVTLGASFGTQAERFPDLASWAGRFINVGPSLQIPIFEGGKLRATVRLQNIREKEAAVTYAKAVLNALHEVENALIAYSTEQNRRQALQATMAHNRNVLALARQRYKSGLTAFLDVLDAERVLQQTELSLSDSTAAVSIDLVALYKAERPRPVMRCRASLKSLVRIVSSGAILLVRGPVRPAIWEMSIELAQLGVTARS